MTIHAGDTITTVTYVEGSPGVGSSLPPASVFSVIEAFAPDGSVITPAPIVTSLEDPGFYEVSFITDPTQDGTYELRATGAELGDVYLEEWVVGPAIAILLGGISVEEFFLTIADELADHIQLTATQNAAGANVIIAENDLGGGDGELRSSHARVRSAADPLNVGRIVRIRGNDSTALSATFAPDLASPLLTGDILDVVNLGGYGFRPDLYFTHIKNAVIKSYPDYLIEINAISDPDVFSADDPFIPIPDEFVAVHSVLFMFDSDPQQWTDVRPARSRGAYGNGWSLDRPGRRIRIDGWNWQDRMDGTAYVIGGYAKHDLPTDYASVISIAADWIIMEVKSTLAARRISDRRWNDWAVEWGRRADAKKADIWTPRHADTQFLST